MTKIPNGNDEVGRITLVMYANGEMGISGNVGDVSFALTMLDQAKEAVQSQLGYRLAQDKKKILLPSSSVEVEQNLKDYPVEPIGDRGIDGHPGYIRPEARPKDYKGPESRFYRGPGVPV